MAGAATSIQPTRVGRLGIVAGFDGEVSSVDLYTGATRVLGTAGTLLGDPRTRANAFAVTGDTLYVIGQEQPVQVGGVTLGPVLIAQVEPATGAVLARYAVPARPQDYLGPFRPTTHGPLLVIPTGGSVVVVDRTMWAVRGRDSSANVGDPAIRNGHIYTGDGIGDVVVRELETAALVRRVRTNTATINVIYPCGDDLYFASGSLRRLPSNASPRASVTGESFARVVWSAGTLCSNSADIEVALRCP